MGKRTEPVKFDPRLRAALEETGLEWGIEPGTKHFKLRLAGRLVCVIPQGVKGDNSRIMTAKNVKSVQRLAAVLQGKG
jgi:hypothetical protein